MSKVNFKKKRTEFKNLVDVGEKSFETMAAKLAVSVELVEQWHKQDFLKPAVTFPQKRERFKELYTTGKFTLFQIREILGISHGCISNWRRQDFPEGAQWKREICWILYQHGFVIERLQMLLNVERGSILRYIRQSEALKAQKDG